MEHANLLRSSSDVQARDDAYQPGLRRLPCFGLEILTQNVSISGSPVGLIESNKIKLLALQSKVNWYKRAGNADPGTYRPPNYQEVATTPAGK